VSFSEQVRDPVHGFIRWSKPCHVDIVDTPTFQRLRRIKQLAFASYVYPGATHTRFEHSLGVYHIAGRLAKQMKLDEGERELVELAALLHDIGHGPFSHVSENILDQFYSPKKGKPSEKEKIHEVVAHEVIMNDKFLAKLISKDMREKVTQLLKDGYGDQVLKDIVSGPLDADKMDYLLRDSLYCGVRYGIYDLDQLINSLTVGGGSGLDRTLMIDRDGLHAVEQFVLAKYYISTQVYFHKVRLITDQMLTRAIVAGIKTDGIDELSRIFTYDGSSGFARRYLEWDDERLLREFTSDRYRRTVVHDLLTRLRTRRLYKRVYSKKITEFSPELRRGLDSVEQDDARFSQIEREIAERLDKRVFEVIVKVFDVKNVKEAYGGSEGPVLVQTPAGEVPFEAESELFDSIDKKYRARYVDCYLATSFKDPKDKRRQEKAVESQIDQALVRLFGKCSSEEMKNEPQRQ
jgi:hypothetical protein